MEKDKDAIRKIKEAYAKMQEEGIESYRSGKPNLEEISRRTNLSRKVIQRLWDNNLEEKAHGNCGEKGFRIVDATQAELAMALLKSGVKNSVVIMTKLQQAGYTGSLSTVKRYVQQNRSMIPSEREIAILSNRKIRRYSTSPGEMYQMDWGFVNVEDVSGNTFKCACFAMVCHHCGFRFVEFFPNAKQENLFIGMIHAFSVMGVPDIVLTDNMASVSNRRDRDGKPIFNQEYDAFQRLLGIETRLCKPRHPWTKGAVERLVRFVKDNFVQGRSFVNITDLNEQVLSWCMTKNMEVQQGLGVVPIDSHVEEPLGILPAEDQLLPYLAPSRSISNDGFVCYEGRKYGVPLSLAGKVARVLRYKEQLYILDPESFKIVENHYVDWSKKPHYSSTQFESYEPEEYPTAPVKVVLKSIELDDDDDFSKFDF